MAVPLVLGLVIGGVGASFFRDSLPGEKGSAEERVSELEAELKKAENRIAAFEADGKTDHRERTLREGIGDIARKLRDGGKVTPDDLLRATQPLARDLSPIFERMHAKQLQREYDALAGEVARKYDLTDEQQQQVKAWFEAHAQEQAEHWMNVVSREGATMTDLAEAAQNARADDGLDGFMSTVLQGEKLAQFRSDRLHEKAGRVQDYADMRVQRIDNIVDLDESQRDRLFGVMAAGSPDYDASMRFEGASGEIEARPGVDREQAIESVLTPGQREAYQTYKDQQREAANKEMSEFGLTLPADWDPLDWR
ncbi:hypothetical protein Hsar01_00530 [Haloferula sargassicola]|uniref:Uncharacterized protein n=2 Tax=Haloferula sargassicola TaxID=490096 RepID=A0ABP9UNG8_9BACT